MIVLILICSLLTIYYALLMIAYHNGWTKQPDYTIPFDFTPSTFISVIIPARNERDKIGACIESILDQKYPKELFEIIVVDDHSDDGTAEIVAEYQDKNVRCISLAAHIQNEKTISAYKKAALAAGITNSTGILILTTDADCIAPNAWLLHIASIYEKEGPVMIVAPVMYANYHGILQLFQLIDFIGAQGITAASHSLSIGNMSNGANLAFSKSDFIAVGGYDGIEHIASGDDLLLTQKMKKASSGKIVYMKSPNAIVTTLPQPTWYDLLQQRVRWASKFGKYDDRRLAWIVFMGYMFNLALLIVGVWGFFNPYLWHVALTMVIVKIITEGYFLLPVARFFHKESVLKYLPFIQPLHVLYIVITGILGFIGKYEWKGRWVK